ncbi:MAG: peptidoglycan editing factor PgeF [Peptococcaceae bacterium]|nr:MAG: peptidoglycan editing factor PgeF [Peptococcaceae bacterium]
MDWERKMPYYTFSRFNVTGMVVHSFTTRYGGVSKKPYDTLNMAFHVGDEPRSVLANRSLACERLGIEQGDLVAGRQAHGDRVAVVTAADRGRGAFEEETALPGTDALITNVPGLTLAGFYADCASLLLLDPVRRVAALAHAGWRGTALRIGQKTLRQMSVSFGTDPRDCLAGIAPSIGPCCYEVGDRVIDDFKKTFSNWRVLAAGTAPGKWRLDLWEANRRVLLDAGLRPENIAVAGLCTACHSDVFFSYRAHGGVTGRMAAFLMLRE